MKKIKALCMLLLMLMFIVTPFRSLQFETFASVGDIIVSTQKELNDALKKTGNARIIIKYSSGKALKIKAGNYKKKSVVIEASSAKVSNYGEFKDIKIKDAVRFIENGSNNKINIADAAADIKIGPDSFGDELIYNCKDGELTLEIKGTINSLALKSSVTADIYGKTTEPIKVKGSNGYADVMTKIKLDAEQKGEAFYTFGTGSEGSVLKIKNTDDIFVDNFTKNNVFIEMSENAGKSVKKIILPEDESFSAKKYDGRYDERDETEDNEKADETVETNPESDNKTEKNDASENKEDQRVIQSPVVTDTRSGFEKLKEYTLNNGDYDYDNDEYSLIVMTDTDNSDVSMWISLNYIMFTDEIQCMFIVYRKSDSSSACTTLDLNEQGISGNAVFMMKYLYDDYLMASDTSFFNMSSYKSGDNVFTSKNLSSEMRGLANKMINLQMLMLETEARKAGTTMTELGFKYYS